MVNKISSIFTPIFTGFLRKKQFQRETERDWPDVNLHTFLGSTGCP